MCHAHNVDNSRTTDFQSMTGCQENFTILFKCIITKFLPRKINCVLRTRQNEYGKNAKFSVRMINFDRLSETKAARAAPSAANTAEYWIRSQELLTAGRQRRKKKSFIFCVPRFHTWTRFDENSRAVQDLLNFDTPRGRRFSGTTARSRAYFNVC